MIYIHKKSGKEYLLLYYANMEHDGSVVVVYQNIGTDVIWVRPLLEWDEKFKVKEE
jgi:hypothetical protein